MSAIDFICRYQYPESLVCNQVRGQRDRKARTMVMSPFIGLRPHTWLHVEAHTEVPTSTSGLRLMQDCRADQALGRLHGRTCACTLHACAPSSYEQSGAGETPNRELHTRTLYTIHACMHTCGDFLQRLSNGGHVTEHDGITKADMPALTVCVRNPMWLSLRGWRRSITQRRPQVQGLSSRTNHVYLLEASRHGSRIRHVAPTDERLGIVVLDWYCFALETA